LKEAFAQVAAAGSQNLELAKRLGGRALDHVKKMPTTARLQEQKVAELLCNYSHAASEAAVPRVSISLDCSRVSGEKTMVLFMTHLEQAWHLWLPVQAVRDFAAQAEHQLTRAAPALQSQWDQGLRSFLQDFSSH
jgi:ABC-type Zn2+ transport system substrate-binding protein/surface adhesin